MTAPVPKKVTEQISEEISALMPTLARYIDPSDPMILDWTDRLEKAMPAGRKAYFIAMSMVYHMTGNIDATEKMFARAATQGASEFEILSYRIHQYENMGFQSLALGACRQILSLRTFGPETGLHRAIGCGGFKLAADLLKQAELMKVDLQNVSQIDSIRHVAKAAEGELGVDDVVFARVLDLAGKQLRKRQLFWLGRHPGIDFDEEMRTVGIRYSVDVSADEAAAMTDDFIDNVINEGLENVPITVRFLGVAVPAAQEVMEA